MFVMPADGFSTVRTPVMAFNASLQLLDQGPTKVLATDIPPMPHGFPLLLESTFARGGALLGDAILHVLLVTAAPRFMT